MSVFSNLYFDIKVLYHDNSVFTFRDVVSWDVPTRVSNLLLTSKKIEIKEIKND